MHSDATNYIDPYAILGSTGLRHSGGRITEEMHPLLAGPRALRLYREMLDNDSTVGTIMFLVDTWITSAEWRIEPADEYNLVARRWAKFVEECIDDMSHSWEEFLSEALTFLGYGHSVFEQVYKERGGDVCDPTRRSKYSDGLIGWRKISPRSQDTISRWDLDADGGIKGFWQRLPMTGEEVYIPIEKALLFRTRSHNNNPEGRSLLRNAVRPYRFAKRISEIEAIGIERELAGLPYITLPPELMSPNATAAQKAVRDAMETLVTQIRRDEREGIVMPAEFDRDNKPTGYKLGLLTGGGARAINPSEPIKRYQRDIAITCLAEFVFVGMDKVGSFSLHSSKTDAFAMALGAYMDKICGIINRFAIPRLMRLNGCPAECYPKLVHGDLETPPLAEISQYVTGLAGAGMLQYDPKMERKLRELAGLPELDEQYAEQQRSPASLPGIERLLPGAQPATQAQQAEPSLLDSAQSPATQPLSFNSPLPQQDVHTLVHIVHGMSRDPKNRQLVRRLLEMAMSGNEEPAEEVTV